jgi:hypothetical protein
LSNNQNLHVVHAHFKGTHDSLVDWGVLARITSKVHFHEQKQVAAIAQGILPGGVHLLEEHSLSLTSYACMLAQEGQV